MKQEIIDLQPELIKSSKETEELQVLVEADAEKANAKRVSCALSSNFEMNKNIVYKEILVK